MSVLQERVKLRLLTPSLNSPKATPAPSGYSTQGIATLVVMIAVLTIIMLFCCFAAPGIRDLCNKYVFRHCVMDDPETNNDNTTPQSSTPTIILLPFGRMLVVDRTVFQQLQSDPTGLDFLELSANFLRNQRYLTDSTPESDNTSKILSPTSLGLSPPPYEDIIANKDLPPSYSELSFLFASHDLERHKLGSKRSMQNMEMCCVINERSRNLDNVNSESDNNNKQPDVI